MFKTTKAVYAIFISLKVIFQIAVPFASNDDCAHYSNWESDDHIQRWMWVMNINSIPQRCRGISFSVILSPQMSMQVNKQMHGTRINGASNRRGERGRMQRDGEGKTQHAQWCLKRILRVEHFDLQKVGLSKIYILTKDRLLVDSSSFLASAGKKLLFCDSKDVWPGKKSACAPITLKHQKEKKAIVLFVPVDFYTFVYKLKLRRNKIIIFHLFPFFATSNKSNENVAKDIWIACKYF